MATKHQFKEEEAMGEILRRALQKEELDGQSVRERLIVAGAELGLSPESVIKAEEEYREERKRTEELEAFADEQRKSFYSHVVIYAAVNAFLVYVNIMSFHKDHKLWVLYPLLGWGIGIVAHAMTTFGKVDRNSDEFRSWRRKRLAAQTTEEHA